MPFRTRRNLRFGPYQSQPTVVIGGTSYNLSASNYAGCEEFQETTDNYTLWPGYQKLKRRPHTEGAAKALDVLSRLDLGGQFSTRRRRVVGQPHVADRNYTYGVGKYSYPSWPQSPDIWPTSSTHPKWPPYPATSASYLLAKGATAISKTIPGSPSHDLLTQLAELRRDGLPDAPGAGLKSGFNPRNLAGEFLNWEFGIKPTVRDIQSLLKTVNDHQSIVDRYFDNAGKQIRRRYSFPDDIDVTSSTSASGRYPFPALPTQAYTSSGVLSTVRHYRRRMWFSACYIYYAPSDRDLLGRLNRSRQAAYLLGGIGLNPEAAWNATSYSWLVDWVSNVGDVLHNISVLTNLDVVIRYAYLMCHEAIEDTYTLTGVSGPNVPSALSLGLVSESKSRIHASPYGFGLTWEGFSPKQLAILAALGITRIPERSG